nr:heat shock 70 kDa protein 14-like isoform X2 [Nicotiana tomentosiformis]
MSVVGFDFGNESGVVAVARQRGIDVVLNDESKRETPAIVCFGEKQRFLGTAGAASSMMNPKNTISQIKRLIGRKFSDPELQRDIKALPFSVTEGPDGYPLIHALYLGEMRTFTPTQVLGMVFSDLKTIAEKNLNAAVVDCCIGIPIYFTDLQRRAVMDAAMIAGLHPLHLIHETTATALAYGIYKTDLPENDPLNVAFIDVGHASLQVCIAGFKKGQLKILAHSFDRNLGGRDFDEALFQHFAAKFKEEYKIDVFQNARACIRLRAACEKLKKVLSANPEAPLNIECLMDEKDVRGFIKREEFEQISIPILERVKKPLENALAEAGFTTENIHAVEVVGSSSRVPAIMRILTEFFGKEPRRTMNASECVAKGCALQCAILSPTFKVREFQIGPFQSAKGERAKLKVKVRLNLHGIVSVDSATLLEEEEVEVPVVKEAVKEPAEMETDEASGDAAPSTTSESDVNMQDAKGAGDASVAENDVPESGDKPVKMETDAKVEAPKKKVKKTSVPVTEIVYGAMAAADVQKAVEKEFEMALQDRVMEETKDKKNAVEAYVYDMRNKLSDKYQEFVIDSEREQFMAKLQEVEDWLYEDGEDETKGVYIAKLEELKKQGDPIEQRYKEYMERGSVIDQFVYCINSYREAAMSNDPKFDHIDLAEKQKVLNECVEAESWFREKKQQQDALPKYANPVLLSADVRKKAEALDRVCRPIMTKPKPKPAKPATPETPSSQSPQGGEQQPQSAESPNAGNANATEGASAGNEVPPAAEPMETEKCETLPSAS